MKSVEKLLESKKKNCRKFYVAMFCEGWTVVSRLHLKSLGKVQWFVVVFGVFFNFIINGKNFSSYYTQSFG